MKKFGLICFLAVCICLLAGATAQASTATYTVKQGDCLWTISNSSGVSVSTIKQLNGLSSDFLSIGQMLILSNNVATPVSAPTASPVRSAGASTYIVFSGDNLWTIAQKFGTTVEAIRAANGLSGDFLEAGQSLIINGTNVSRSGDSVTGDRVVAKAAQYLGTPYRYGGTTPAGFDCSGFTRYIFSLFGISLTHNAAAQYNSGVAVSKADLMPGDLVFFACGGHGISHVGIYCGKGNFIHSSSPNSGGVIYSSLDESYYTSYYVGARRVTR